jgi:two-component system CheB/CheR fusion protein
MSLLAPGRGLNSIRWRFAIAGAVLTLAGVAGRDTLLARLGTTPAWAAATLLVLALLVAGAIYWMAQRLTGLIDALRRSTEAIAAGDFSAPVDVDCACEIGGLANSFRKMTTRMNANVVRINALAYSDSITGLPNRSVVDRMLGYALAPERAGSFSAAIVFIDLDGFKRINDTLGHDAGDELLRLASLRILHQGLQRSAETIDTCLDMFGMPCERLPTDVVFARFAGDEFVAILPGLTGRAALSEVGERIVASLAEPFRLKGQDVRIGASVGIAVTPDDTTDAAELLAFADLAMYGSKQAGKSRYRFFDKQARESMIAVQRVEAELQQALQRYELLLYFQPKLDMQSLQPHGVEALVRWQHPQRGLLLPGEFIDIAERAGLMAALGRRVLVLAATQCRQWLDAGLSLNVAVNVSPSQFNDPAFVGDVLQTLQVAGVPPQLLSIEITESMAMADFEATARRLAELREAGVMVALDDFGIGYSNLSQLSRLPLDVLKIDRSLVQGIGADPKREAIIRAIVGMTHALGCRAIAEGIETEAQFVFLQGLGCDCAQGFLLARPMPPKELAHWQCPWLPQGDDLLSQARRASSTH